MKLSSTLPRIMPLPMPPAWVGAWLLTAFLTGCGQNDVQVYKLAKEPSTNPPTSSTAMPPGHPEVAGGMPKLEWKLPSGWQEVSPGPMRLASFKATGANGKQADVGVFPLPGLAGSDLDNVNRWREQVGLAPVSEAELSQLAQPVRIGSDNAQLFDLAGTNASSGEKTRILAAVLRREGTAWFFKMTGDDELVAQQKPLFSEFLKSVKFPGAAGQGLPPSHPPIAGPAGLNQARPAAVASAAGKPNWQVPAGWQEVPGNQFLVAKFVIGGTDNGQTVVNVSRSSGDGGGFVANVNRWRTQLGLGQLSESEVAQLATAVDVSSGKAMLIDMNGADVRTGQKTRLVGAVVLQEGQSWFYKLMGNEEVVQREKKAFGKFVQSAKYN